MPSMERLQNLQTERCFVDVLIQFFILQTRKQRDIESDSFQIFTNNLW